MVEYHLIISIIACIIGFLMAWGIGANDLANIVSATIGAKSISVRQAIIIAIIFEFAGALLGGAHVTATIKNGIINMDILNHTPNILAAGMLCTLFAGMIWINFASYLGMPVSITNAIIGAIIGFGSMVLGLHAVKWHVVWLIAASWICSPLIAGLSAYFLFTIVKKTILAVNDPIKNIHRYMPMYFFFVGIVFALMAVLKNLNHFGYHPSCWERVSIVIGIGLITAIIGTKCSKTIRRHFPMNRHERYEYIEKIFGILTGFTACAMVFAHGSNDVAIAIGPVVSIINLMKTTAQGLDTSSFALTALGCFGVILGFLMYGRKVIVTVGERITALTPSRAFSATLAAASTVIFSTSAGIPVSATQTLVGGVLGVGLAKGIGALNLRIIRNIILSWVVTVPVCAILTIVFFYSFRFLSHT